MYKQQLRVYGEYLAKEQSIPTNGEQEGNQGAGKAGSMLGAGELVLAAAGEVRIANGKTLRVKLTGSKDNKVFSTLPVSFSKQASSNSMQFSSGEVMARLPLASDTPSFVKVIIGTNDSGASGSVDAFFEYLPR